MGNNTIDASKLASMFLAGAKNLEAKKEWINELNVFPVPDGDTGTNMTMTIMSAANEVSSISEMDMKSLAKAISSGSLRGARGNSGVILSQLLRGFTKAISEVDEIDVYIMCEAFQRAVETAYKAVMKPKEGTILTVAKGAANKALSLVDETDDMLVFCDEVFAEAQRVLKKTPDMLPVLKQAGVVDSGGQGLVEVMRGALDILHGREVDLSLDESQKTSGIIKISAETEAEIKFGYCTEYIIVLNKPFTDADERKYKEFLESIGDSIVVVADDDMVKTHVHTNEPDRALHEALTHGSLSKIKIDNMREEHEEKLIKNASKIAAQEKLNAAEAETNKDEPPKDMGFVVVCAGSGLSNIFKDLGADYIIEGGQTMNPSTEDILDAVAKVNAKTVFVLPNNKNIILAANQAADIEKDKKIIVVPTTTIPQGVTALINFITDQSPEENLERMNEEISIVKTGQITYAVRDTQIDDKEIKKGDYMGLGDAGIESVSQDIKDCFLGLADAMIDEESAIFSIYFGEDVSEEDANALSEEISSKYPDIDVEVSDGGQPVYYYIVSVE